MATNTIDWAYLSQTDTQFALILIPTLGNCQLQPRDGTYAGSGTKWAGSALLPPGKIDARAPVPLDEQAKS